MSMQIMILIIDHKDGEELVQPSITSLHQQEEVVEINNQNLHLEANSKTLLLPQILIFAALIVKLKGISLEKLTKF